MKKKDSTDRHSTAGGTRLRPAVGSGYRSGRLAGRRRSRQRLARLLIVAGLAAAVLLFAGITFFMRGFGDGPVQAGAPVEGGAVVMTGRDDAGALSQILVLLPGGQEGYRVFTVMPRTVAEVPGYGFMRLDEALATGGQPLLEEALSGLFEAPVSARVEFDYGALEVLASRVATINFPVGQPWAAADGSVALAAGDNPAGADQALEILKAAVSDGAAGPGLQALFYQGLREALAGLPEDERRAAAAAFAGQVSSDIGAGEVASLAEALLEPEGLAGVWPLPVTLVGGGSWYLEPVPAQLKAITGAAAGAETLLELRNGTTVAGAAEAAAEQLQLPGFSISLVPGISEVEFAHTQIRCGSEALKQGNQVREALGRGTIIKDDNLEKNAITVIIGRDLAGATGN